MKVNAGAIEKIAKYLTGATSYSELIFHKRGKALVMSVVGTQASASHALGAMEEEMARAVAVDSAAFMAFIKGKGDLDISFNESNVKVKAKGAEAEFTFRDELTPPGAVELKEGVISLAEDAWTWMSDCVSNLSIAEQTVSPSRVFCRIGPKVSLASVFNSYQMDFILTKEITSPNVVDVDVPAAQLTRLLKSFPLTGASIAVTDEALTFKTKAMQATFPLDASAAKQDHDDLYEKAVALWKAKGDDVEFDVASLKSFLESVSAIATTGVLIDITGTEKGGALAKMQAAKGSVKANIVTSGLTKGAKLSVDYEYLQRAAKTAGAEKLLISVLNDGGAIKVTTSKSVFVAAAGGDQGGE